MADQPTRLIGQNEQWACCRYRQLAFSENLVRSVEPSLSIVRTPSTKEVLPLKWTSEIRWIARSKPNFQPYTMELNLE